MLQTVPVSGTAPKIDAAAIPAVVGMDIGRVLSAAIERDFRSPEFAKKYNKWKKEMEAKP